jgi:hypothetical protein
MVFRWRGLAVVGIWVVTFAGCSGESSRDPGTPASHAGTSGAGRGGTGGTGGSGTSTGGTGGTTNSEGGAAGVVEEAGHAGTGGMAGRSAAGGTGGSLSFAGSGGTAAVGGFGNVGGRGGTGGSGASAGSGSRLPPAWQCHVAAYGDGVCDCGCGAPDSDCKTGDVDECKSCDGFGSCNGAKCPGRIDPDDTTTCTAIPLGWSCAAAKYADGNACDCGCGIPDPDCKDGATSSCDACEDVGACSHGPCPSSVATDDNTKCFVPEMWICLPYAYGDGVCDCGCGVVDVDCKNATSAACDNCPWYGCSAYNCTTIAPTNNAVCSVPPADWRCAARLYNDGTRCDCGCGFPDPDCKGRDLEACDRCDSPGSCSAQACPGTIDPNQDENCIQPPPPAGWTCSPYNYADGSQCDCGCGVPDLDCATADLSACDYCPLCAFEDCSESIDSADTTQCNPPPAGWTCDPSHYGEGYSCDCGCGVLDPDCPTNSANYCTECPTEGCAGGQCQRIAPSDNTQCTSGVPATWKCDRTFYGDGLCDCGCGALDSDCANANRSSCDICNDAGGCSTTVCPGTILASDNTSCADPQ